MGHTNTYRYIIIIFLFPSITFFWGGLPILQRSCDAKKETRKKKHGGRKKEKASVALRCRYHVWVMPYTLTRIRGGVSDVVEVPRRHNGH